MDPTCAFLVPDPDGGSDIVAVACNDLHSHYFQQAATLAQDALDVCGSVDEVVEKRKGLLRQPEDWNPNFLHCLRAIVDLDATWWPFTLATVTQGRLLGSRAVGLGSNDKKATRALNLALALTPNMRVSDDLGPELRQARSSIQLLRPPSVLADEAHLAMLALEDGDARSFTRLSLPSPNSRPQGLSESAVGVNTQAYIPPPPPKARPECFSAKAAGAKPPAPRPPPGPPPPRRGPEETSGLVAGPKTMAHVPPPPPKAHPEGYSGSATRPEAPVKQGRLPKQAPRMGCAIVTTSQKEWIPPSTRGNASSTVASFTQACEDKGKDPMQQYPRTTYSQGNCQTASSSLGSAKHRLRMYRHRNPTLPPAKISSVKSFLKAPHEDGQRKYLTQLFVDADWLADDLHTVLSQDIWECKGGKLEPFGHLWINDWLKWEEPMSNQNPDAAFLDKTEAKRQAHRKWTFGEGATALTTVMSAAEAWLASGEQVTPRQMLQAESERSVSCEEIALENGIEEIVTFKPHLAASEGDPEGQPFNENVIVVNFLNVAAFYGKKVLHRQRGQDQSIFDWEGVRRCVRYLTTKRNFTVVGVVRENWFATDNDSPEKRTIPDDIRASCESIQETPRIVTANHFSADDEMTIKCAYWRNCRFLDNDNYRDWKEHLHDVQCKSWLAKNDERLHMRYYFDTSLGAFELLEGNKPKSSLTLPNASRF